MKKIFKTRMTVNQRVSGSSPEGGAKGRQKLTFFVMYYIYILFSPSFDVNYVGYSTDPWRRLEEHNSKPVNSFTAKYRPWVIAAVFECSTEEGEAMRIEKFIEKQKSRKILEQLIDPHFIPNR